MKKIDLLTGKILPTLTKLTIPIVMTSFMMMAYSLIDMIYISHLGANAVAAVGVSGMFNWLYSGLAFIVQTGGQVKVGHSLGAKNDNDALSFSSSAIQLGIIFSILFGLFTFFGADFLISLFNLNNKETITQAILYLQVTGGICIFSFLNCIFTGIFNSTGDSKSPFIGNTVGLVFNLIMDPLLIFGIGFFPKLGVLGAALATVLAQLVGFIVFVIIIIKKHSILARVKLFVLYKKNYYQEILKIGFPLGLQSMLFSICSMIVARFVAGYGDGAVAAQKIGTQIESITWALAEGLQAGINSFTAQNYGAKQFDRVNRGHKTVMYFSTVWGIFCSLLLIIFPKEIFSIFLSDPKVIDLGVSYLRIIGISQFFMVLELVSTGVFSGLGNSMPPSIIGIIFTCGRIPCIMIALYLNMGLDSIWWIISLSSIFKGTLLSVWLHYYKKERINSEMAYQNII